MPGQGRLGDKTKVDSDAHGCPGCPHPGVGPAISGSPTVFVNGRPALRVDDVGIHAACCGTNMWQAVQGSVTVFINGKAAFRKDDPSKHCGGQGTLIEGSSNVIVGDGSSGGGNGNNGAGHGAKARDALGGATSASTAASQSTTSPASKPASAATTKTRLALRLVGIDGQPIAGQRVQITPPGGTPAPARKTDGDGRASLDVIDAGMCQVVFPDLARRATGPIPDEATLQPASGQSVTRSDAATTFAAATSDSDVRLFQLERQLAVVFECEHFGDGGAVLLPATDSGVSALQVIAAVLRRPAAQPGERLFVTGHAPATGGAPAEQSRHRADSLVFALAGQRDEWSQLAANTAVVADLQAVLRWADGAFSFGCDPGAADGSFDAATQAALDKLRAGYVTTVGKPAPLPADVDAQGHAGAATWAAIFDLYMRELERLLDTDSDGRRALQDALPWVDQQPAPPVTTPRPYLLIRAIDSIWPVKIAELATGNANDYVQLNPLNPDKVLPNGGGWRNLGAGDRIYLVPAWAGALLRHGYDVRDDASPAAPPVDGKGRPLGYPHLVLQPSDSLWPVKIAELATGNANDYKKLEPLNPHLMKGPGAWKDLYAGEMINLPDEAWAQKLSDARYVVARDPAPPPPPKPQASAARSIASREHHLHAPYAGDTRRRVGERRAEIVFVDAALVPLDVCKKDGPACDAADCALYDPRELVLDYQPIAAEERGDLGVTVVDEATNASVPGAEITVKGPETRSAIAGDDGVFVFRLLTAGTYEVIAAHPGFAGNSRTASVVAGASTSSSSSSPASARAGAKRFAGDATPDGSGSARVPLTSTAKAHVLAYCASFPANNRTEILGARQGSFTQLSPPQMAQYLADRKVFPPLAKLTLEWQIDHPDDVLVDLTLRPVYDRLGQTNPNHKLLLPSGVQPRDYLTSLTRAGKGKASIDYQHTRFPDGTIPDGSFFVDLALYDPTAPSKPIARYVVGGYADFPQPSLDRFWVDTDAAVASYAPDGTLRFDIPCEFAVSETAFGHALWVVVIDEASNKVIHKTRLKPHQAGPLAGRVELDVDTGMTVADVNKDVRLKIKAALLCLGSEVPAGNETEAEFRIVDPEGHTEGAAVARSPEYHVVEAGFAFKADPPKAPAAGDEVVMVWVDLASGVDERRAAILLLSGNLIRARATTSLAAGDYDLTPDVAAKRWTAGGTTDFKLVVDGLDPFGFAYPGGKTRLHITNGLAFPLPGTNELDTTCTCEDFVAPVYQLDYRPRSPGDRSTFVRVSYGTGDTQFDADIDVVHDVGDEEMSAADARKSWEEGVIGPGNRLFPKRMNKSTTPRLWNLRKQVLDILGQDFLLATITLGAKVVEFIITIDPFPGGWSFGRSYRSSYTTSTRTRAFKELIDEARWGAAGALRDRAGAWKWAWRNPRGTVAVARARNLKTGEVRDFVSANGRTTNPFGQHWTAHHNLNEEFIGGAGHAEENLVNGLSESEWQIESVGVTTNICKGCSPQLAKRGLSLGGPSAPYLLNSTDYKLAIKATAK